MDILSNFNSNREPPDNKEMAPITHQKYEIHFALALNLLNVTFSTHMAKSLDKSGPSCSKRR